MNTHAAAAKKIGNIFSDARYTKADIDQIALLTVIECRQNMIFDRIEYFLERFTEHRNNIEFGRTGDEVFHKTDLFSANFPDIVGA